MDFHRHALILAMIENLRAHGGRTGKVHVIKGLALGSLSGLIDLPFEFFLYKHGPYSTDIVQSIEEMASYDAISVQPAFDGWGVILKPSENAVFIKRRVALSEREQRGIERVCQFLLGKNATELERLATALWIRKRMHIDNQDDVAVELNKLKPHISITDAREADREVMTLGSAIQF